MTDTTHGDLVMAQAARKLNEVHRQVCFARQQIGDHALEVDTPYSLGAAAINLTTALTTERDALEAKLALVIAAYRIEAMRREDYSHDAFDQHIAELKGQSE